MLFCIPHVDVDWGFIGIWDADFENRYDDFPLDKWDWDTDIFGTASFDDSILQFYNYNGQSVDVEGQYYLYFNPSHVNNGEPGSFGIRQVATTSVPEPSTILLLGAGLAGVGILRRRFKK